MLSYCSPSRFGRRDVRVEVSVPAPDGRKRVASFGARFDATGFTAGCDAKAPPRFLVTLLLDRHGAVAGAAPEPVEEETEEADAEAEGGEKIELEADRKVTRGALYVTLDRLTAKRLVEWEVEETSSARGGIPRRRFRVTQPGLEALRRSQAAVRTLSRGLEDILGEV